MRTPITTSWGNRTKPTTTMSTPRAYIKWDEWNIAWQDNNCSWDNLTYECTWIKHTTVYTTPRKNTYLEDINEINIFWVDWQEILLVSWPKVNKIETVWT